MTVPGSDARTALYRLYGASDRLLYVGITDNPNRRWTQHATDKPWWPEVTRKALAWLDTREDAAAAETAAIRGEKPVHNHTHNPSAILGRLDNRAIPDGPNAEPSPWRPFQIVANDLRDLICHDMQPGDKLPTTQQLVDAFGVSNPTIQKALLLLKAEGFATSRPGSAVYAAVPNARRVEPAGRQDDGEGDIELLLVQQSKPSPRTCAALQVPRGTEVRERRWLRRIGGVPVELVRSFQHPDAAPGERRCRTVDGARAAIPTPYQAKTLRMTTRGPVLAILRTFFNRDGRPICAQEIAKVGHLNTVEYRC